MNEGSHDQRFKQADMMRSSPDPHISKAQNIARVNKDRKAPAYRVGQSKMSFRHMTWLSILVAILAPILVHYLATGGNIAQRTQYNTAFGSAVALLLGIIAYQRLRVFPGIISGGYIFMSFSAAFGTLAAILLIMRIDYSGVQFVATYFISIALYVFLHQKIVVRHQMRVGVVPGGEATNLPVLSYVDWVALDLGQQDVFESVDIVVADLHADHSDAWDEQITRIVMTGTPVYHFKQILEQTTGRVEINHLSENTLGSLNPNDFYLKVKSLVDVVIAAQLLILLAPIILLVAVLVRLDSPGPAFFRQARTGYRMRTFTLYKIRTMRTVVATTASSEQETRNAAMTQIGDPRITRLGAFLRRSRLDELPQLINIVRGEMSLIGPRPEAVPLSKWYENEIPFYHYRHIIKPGVTGWAQINQGHVVDVSDIREKLHLDFYYVKNFSFWLDILISVRTMQTMITGKGAR